MAIPGPSALLLEEGSDSVSSTRWIIEAALTPGRSWRESKEKSICLCLESTPSHCTKFVKLIGDSVQVLSLCCAK